MTPRETKAVFLKRAARVTGFTESEIRRALGSKFGRYDRTKETQYMAFLKAEASRKEEEAYQKAQVLMMQRILTVELPVEECPFHHAKVYANSKTSEKEAWTCEVGGVRCYLRWRAEKIYGKPIDWESFDRFKASLPADVTPEISEYRKWKEANNV